MRTAFQNIDGGGRPRTIEREKGRRAVCDYSPSTLQKQRPDSRRRRDMTATKAPVSRSNDGAIDKIIPYHQGVHAALRKCDQGLLRRTDDRFLDIEGGIQ